MAGPKHQHFIPKSYLRNFSTIVGDKAFVETMNIHSGEIKYPVSINDICVSKNIYTLPRATGEDRYALERYYAENIDGIYPEVYRLLTNDDIVEISLEDRQKILSTTLSLYFRTSKFMNRTSGELQKVLSFIDNIKFKSETDEKRVFFSDKEYVVKHDNVEKVKEEIRIDNKTNFLVGHLNDWQNFVRHKYHSQITVCKVTPEMPLITSDNPVNIYNRYNAEADVFDPNNSIQLPLDQNYFLWISPNSAKTERNIIYRGFRDKWFAVTSNHSTRANASNFVISNENTLAEGWRQEQRFNTAVPESLEAYDNIKFKAIELSEFVSIAQAKGLHSEEALAKFREFKQNPIFKDDPQFQYMSQQMADKGYY